MRNGYKTSLTWVLKHRRVTLAVTVALFVATIFLFIIMPKGFLPTEDTGQIFAFTEAQQGISFPDMAKHQQQLVDIIAQDPNVEAFMSSDRRRRSERRRKHRPDLHEAETPFRAENFR